MTANTNHAYARQVWGMRLLHMLAGQASDHMGELSRFKRSEDIEERALQHARAYLSAKGYRVDSVTPTIIGIVGRYGGVTTIEHREFDDFPYVEIIGSFPFLHRWLAYWWPDQPEC